MMKFENLPGFRDFYPTDCFYRDFIFHTWRTALEKFTFQPYDAPLLEPLELYLEKSGAEIADQLFAFQDKGGRSVALRPEMTPSLARLVGAKAATLKRPIRWYSIGEFFRYERPQKGRLRAFYQLNVDLFGENSPLADAELIVILIEVLKAFGLGADDFKVRLSDRVLWTHYLTYLGVEEAPVQLQVLAAIDKHHPAKADQTLQRLEGLQPGQGPALWEAVQKLMRLSSFAAIRTQIGAWEAQSPEHPAIVSLKSRLSDWQLILDYLAAYGLGEWVVPDLSIVRGLAYYSGFVFEAFEVTGQSRALAGGGRYDQLVKKLGGPDLAACGFAVGDVTLLDLLREKGKLPTQRPIADVCLLAPAPEVWPWAFQAAQALREAGLRVQCQLKPQNTEKQAKAAAEAGIRWLLVYPEAAGPQNPEVLVRDLHQRTAIPVADGEIVSYISERCVPQA